MEADSTETVYGTTDDFNVMSERIQSLAASIYKEFERLISAYDENVVKEMMPLVVALLENLDQSLQERQEIEVELELLREDNEQLLTQYEREKQLRKSAEQKMLQFEDSFDEDRRHLLDKLESLESIVRMFEIKMKNSQDHITRLEEKDVEAKTEYAKLHERYTDLFKAHMDYVERTKLLNGLDGSQDMSSTPSKRHSGLVHESHETSIVDEVDAPAKLFQQEISYLHHDKSNWSELSGRGAPEVMFDDDLSLSSRTAENTEVDMISEDVQMEEPTLTNAPEPEYDEAKDDEPHVLRLGRHASIYDELLVENNDALGEMDFGADIIDEDSDRHSAGMTREVENLIKDNNDLLATKNALNVVKDDLIVRVDELTGEKEILREEINSLEIVKVKLRARITELEDEVRRTRTALEEHTSIRATVVDDEDNIPSGERKRFTRIEMARVLLERNQYKERLMELQEAVRWTEMVRASREMTELREASKKSSIWNFFSKLFNSSSRPTKKPSSILPPVCYSSESSENIVQPVGDPNRQYRERNGGPRPQKAFDFLQDDLGLQQVSTFIAPLDTGGYDDSGGGDLAMTEKARRLRQQERRSQRQRIWSRRAGSGVAVPSDRQPQAYGWSLPAKLHGTASSLSSSVQTPSQSTIPVPVYCRPVSEDTCIKLCCAAAVNLNGGRTKDGGKVYGASVFYTNSCEWTAGGNSFPSNEVDRLEQELQEHEKGISDLENQQMSPLVWICMSARNRSEVTIVDANSPGDVLDSFIVSQSNILCIASIPGVVESDYPEDNDDNITNTSKLFQVVDNSVESVCVTETEVSRHRVHLISSVDRPSMTVEIVRSFGDGETRVEKSADPVPASNTRSRSFRRSMESGLGNLVCDGVSSTEVHDDVVRQELENSTSLQPTIWLGSDSGWLYIHSAVSQWKQCIHSIQLPSSILSINHIKGRVFIALANGTLAVFRRASNGSWDMKNYRMITVGEPSSVRCLCVVANQRIWSGHRNRIHVLDPKSLKIEKSFDAHPRQESQVQHMVWVGEGVWVSIRLDSTLRLYHAFTYQHLQDVDVEPHVSKLLGVGKLGFSFVRITSLAHSCQRLWVGTGNGVIMSVPLSETTRQSVVQTGGSVRVYGSSATDSVFPGSYIPYCNISQAQLSFHGHKDAVKFFVAVPGLPSSCLSGISGSSTDVSASGNASSKQFSGFEYKDLNQKTKQKTVLVISGGEGYVDFRQGDVEDDESSADEDDNKKVLTFMKGERSHLIVWQMFTNI